MPLAFPLFVFLAAVLSGCAPSARTPFVSADTGKVLPQEDMDFVAFSGSERCFGQKGIAEVVAVEANRIRFRFYPGDELFERSRSEYETFGVRLGDELRAVRINSAGNECGRPGFRLINDRLLDTGPDSVEINEA